MRRDQLKLRLCVCVKERVTYRQEARCERDLQTVQVYVYFNFIYMKDKLRIFAITMLVCTCMQCHVQVWGASWLHSIQTQADKENSQAGVQCSLQSAR